MTLTQWPRRLRSVTKGASRFLDAARRAHATQERRAPEATLELACDARIGASLTTKERARAFALGPQDPAWKKARVIRERRLGGRGVTGGMRIAGSAKQHELGREALSGHRRWRLRHA